MVLYLEDTLDRLPPPEGAGASEGAEVSESPEPRRSVPAGGRVLLACDVILSLDSSGACE